MKNFLAIAILALGAVGCTHAQPSPTPGYNTLWTWTAPAASSTWAGCTSAQNCSYIVSTATVAAGTTTCPQPNGNNYVPQQTAATALTTISWTQQNTTGQLLCAVVSTIWNGETSTASGPSNLVSNPQLPLAPGVPSGNPAVAEVEKPKLPATMPSASAQLAMNAIPVEIRGVVVRR